MLAVLLKGQTDCRRVLPCVNLGTLKGSDLIKKAQKGRNFHCSSVPLPQYLVYNAVVCSSPAPGKYFFKRCARNMGVEQAEAW